MKSRNGIDPAAAMRARRISVSGPGMSAVDAYGGGDYGEHGLQAGVRAGVDAEQRFAAGDGGADGLDRADADGEVDDVAGFRAPRAEGDARAADAAGIHAGQAARLRCANFVDDGRAMDFGEAFERGGVAALRFDEGDEFFPRGAVLQPARELRARGVGDFFREVEGEVDDVGRESSGRRNSLRC